MPLYHCCDCHHEWEGTDDMNQCDRCQSQGRVIQEKTFQESIQAFLEPELKVLRALAAAKKGEK